MKKNKNSWINYYLTKNYRLKIKESKTDKYKILFLINMEILILSYIKV